MSADHHGIGADAVVGSDDVSNRIRQRAQPEPQQFFGKGGRTRGFAKGRRGNLRQADLICFDIRLMVGDELKCTPDAGIRRRA